MKRKICLLCCMLLLCINLDCKAQVRDTLQEKTLYFITGSFFDDPPGGIVLKFQAHKRRRVFYQFENVEFHYERSLFDCLEKLHAGGREQQQLTIKGNFPAGYEFIDMRKETRFGLDSASDLFIHVFMPTEMNGANYVTATIQQGGGKLPRTTGQLFCKFDGYKLTEYLYGEFAE